MAWAQAFLGDSFAFGQGVVQNYAEAAKWYRLAATQGNSSAQYALGFLHLQGQGVRQDFAEAVKWHRLAAAQGNARAQFSLGVLHDQGQGVVRDPKKALRWFSLAADKGSSESVKARDTVAQRMSAQQIGEAQTKARQCLERNFKGCD